MFEEASFILGEIDPERIPGEGRKETTACMCAREKKREGNIIVGLLVLKGMTLKRREKGAKGERERGERCTNGR